MNDTPRITLASFLAYFVMSGMLAPIGIITAPMAEHFGLPVTDVAASFSWLTVGILIGAVAALLLLERVPLRPLMAALYALIVAAVTAIALVDQLIVVRLALGLIGVSCGIGLAAAALTISLAYSPARRASALVATDASFSTAGIILAAVAAMAIQRDWPWWSAYALVGGIAALVIALASTSRFPRVEHAERALSPLQWPTSVWLCVVALMLYTLAQGCLLIWLPNHLTESYAVDPARSGLVISRFWTGMFIAQLLVTVIVLPIGAKRLAQIAVITTTAGSVPMWLMTDIDVLLWLSLVWGVANLGLLKVVLSFATELLAVATGRLVSMLLLGATGGTAIAPTVSSALVERTSTTTVLQFATGCYALMALVFLVATLIGRKHSATP